jgi:hypothetical protein
MSDTELSAFLRLVQTLAPWVIGFLVLLTLTVGYTIHVISEEIEYRRIMKGGGDE